MQETRGRCLPRRTLIYKFCRVAFFISKASKIRGEKERKQKRKKQTKRIIICFTRPGTKEISFPEKIWVPQNVWRFPQSPVFKCKLSLKANLDLSPFFYRLVSNLNLIWLPSARVRLSQSGNLPSFPHSLEHLQLKLDIHGVAKEYRTCQSIYRSRRSLIARWEVKLLWEFIVYTPLKRLLIIN